MIKKLLTLSLVCSIIFAKERPSQKTRLKAAITAGSVMTCAGVALHFLKRKPVSIERITHNLSAIKQTPLLNFKHATPQSFLRTYEQQHTIPTVVKDLAEKQKSLEDTMDQLYKVKFVALEKQDEAKKQECELVINDAHAQLMYVRNLKSALEAFNQKLT